MRFSLHAPLARTRVLVLGGLLLTGSAAFGQADSLAYGELPHQQLVSGRPGRLTLFDKAFYQNQLFLLGESHGAQKPQEIDFELLKHLNEKTGLRYYLAELDATKARYVNAYLKTGDEALLTDVFRSWVVQKAQWANTDFVAKLRKIRALNQTLPPSRQIQFVGIDRIHDKALVAKELGQWLASQQLPPAVRPLADSLTHQLTQQTPDSLAARWALNWLAKWADQEAVYQ